MGSTTTRMKAGALACLAGLALAGCSADEGDAGSGDGPPTIAQDCTEADFDVSSGTATRAECGFGILTVDIDQDGIVVVISEVHVHGVAYLTAMGEMPRRHQTVEQFVYGYHTEFGPYIELELSRPITDRGTGEELGMASDFISADDFSAEQHDHVLVASAAKAAHVTSHATVVRTLVEGDAIIIDGFTSEGPSDAAGFLTVTFPGPVAEANGQIEGNTVTWGWGVGAVPEVYAAYRP